jgi:hypothetical protein
MVTAWSLSVVWKGLTSLKWPSSTLSSGTPGAALSGPATADSGSAGVLGAGATLTGSSTGGQARPPSTTATRARKLPGRE